MLTGDLNTASVEWTVQWKVTEPSQYLFRFPLVHGDEFAADLITFVARTVMNRLVGDYSFDEVIGPKRSDIANEARADTQRILEAYECGITITALQMQRVIPPDRVKPAFDKVNASIQEKQKLENEAESVRNKLLPEAQRLARQVDPRGRGIRLTPPRRGPGRDRGPAGQVSRLSASARSHPPAALPRGHARPASKRERQNDHRCRPQAGLAALEPRFEGREAANDPPPMASPS